MIYILGFKKITSLQISHFLTVLKEALWHRWALVKNPLPTWS